MPRLVSIDVPVLRGVVTDLNDFATQSGTERAGVVDAAARACAGAPALYGLQTHRDTISEIADDLDARIELAILLNTNGSGPPSLDAPLTYELPPGRADTGDLARQMLGEELAALSESIIDSDDPAEDWQVELLGTQLELWSSNDDVMTAFFSSLGPEGTVFLTTEMGYYTWGGGDLDAAQKVVDQVRLGLETASSAWEPTDAEQFGRDMVDAAVSPWDHDYDGSGTTVALSLLMYDSNYSGEFLTGVADRIDEIERVEGVEPGFWSQRSSMAYGMHGFFPEDAMDAAFDPMASVFGSMADQPGVALDWWDDPDRQEYWIADRTWAHDDFKSLASVLNAASTHPSHIDPPFDRNGELRPEAVAAAELASATINYLPQNAGFGSQKDGGFFGLGQSHSWGGEGAGADLANIIATYMPAADDALTQNRSTYPGTGTGYNVNGDVIPLIPYFDKDALATVIQVASRTDEGFATLRNGVSAYNNQQLALAAHSSEPGDSLSAVSSALGSTAEIEGFFMYNVGGGDIKEAEARDARNQAWINLGSDLVGTVPIPGGQVVGFVAKQGIKVTTAQVTDALTGNAAAATADANQMAQESFETYIAQAVWALDDAGALPYQQDGAGSLPDGPGVRDGQLITPEYIQSQPEDQQGALMDDVVEFATSPHGLEAYAIEQNIKGWYKDPFLSYFD